MEPNEIAIGIALMVSGSLIIAIAKGVRALIFVPIIIITVIIMFFVERHVGFLASWLVFAVIAACVLWLKKRLNVH